MGVYLHDTDFFLKMNLGKLAAVWFKKGQKVGFGPYKLENHVNNVKEKAK